VTLSVKKYIKAIKDDNWKNGDPRFNDYFVAVANIYHGGGISCKY